MNEEDRLTDREYVVAVDCGGIKYCDGRGAEGDQEEWWVWGMRFRIGVGVQL